MSVGGGYCIFSTLLAAANSLKNTTKKFRQAPQKFNFLKCFVHVYMDKFVAQINSSKWKK